MNELIETTGDGRNVANPFGNGGARPPKNQTIAETHTNAEVLADTQARVFLAKNFPRDPIAASQRILTACQRLGLAQAAIYTFQRGGSDISGPSIRLAEEIARQWGNIESGWKELKRDDKMATVLAYAWDQEVNTFKQIVFNVPLQRTKRRGGTRVTEAITEERDVYELIANNAARRMRACLLALIPADVTESAVKQCQKTIVTQCEVTPERIAKMAAAFEEFGVSKEQIEKRIQRNITAIAPAQFVKLIEIYNSIKDGISEASDWFEGAKSGGEIPVRHARRITGEAEPETPADATEDPLKALYTSLLNSRSEARIRGLITRAELLGEQGKAEPDRVEAFRRDAETKIETLKSAEAN